MLDEHLAVQRNSSRWNEMMSTFPAKSSTPILLISTSGFCLIPSIFSLILSFILSFSLNPLRFFRRTPSRRSRSLQRCKQDGKMKEVEIFHITADFETFEIFFYQDSHVFGIFTCIADSISESRLSFIHSDRESVQD